MTKLSRRSFFGVLAGAVAAPYVVRTSGLLMPVKNRIIPVALSGIGDGIALQSMVHPLNLSSIREMLLPGLYEITGKYSEIGTDWNRMFRRPRA